MTEIILAFLYYWGIAAGVATILMMLWAWRQVRRQDEAERIRHSLGYRQNVKGWRL